MDPLFNDVYRTLIIEPFYGGSHQQLVDLLTAKLHSSVKYTLPATKWHWKARTSALHFAQVVPRSEHYRVLLASSVLNLAELVAMRKDLAGLHKVLYFHENQLVYPIRKQQDRDFQYGYNQIVSCLIADTILFNSAYNMESFLSGIDSFLGMIPVPGYKSKGMHKPIKPKCRVLYFPLQLPELESVSPGDPGGCRPFVPNQPVVRRTQSEEGACGTGEKGLRTVILRGKSNSNSSFVDEDSDSLDQVVDSSSPRPKFGNFRCARRVSRENMETVSTIATTKQKQKPGARRSLDDPEDPVFQSCDRDESHDSSKISTDSAQSHDGKLHVAAGEKRAMWRESSQKPLHILWAHRWEHDKNPELFFDTLMKLDEIGLEFQVSVLGEQFTEIPDIFVKSKARLQDRIVNWGYQSSKEDYYRVLFAADVAVSTADHEFFGVAMLEAVHLRCYPLCPNCLVYPEIFPKEYLYNTAQQLFKRLREFCRHPHLVRKHNLKVDVGQFSWEGLKEDYLDILSSTLPRIRMKMFPRSSFEVVDRPAPRQHNAVGQSANHNAVTRATSYESNTLAQLDRASNKTVPQVITDQQAMAGYQSTSQHSDAVADSATKLSKATSRSTSQQSMAISLSEIPAQHSKDEMRSASQQSKAITQKYKHLLSHPPTTEKH